jgi:hypothetical protein
MKKIMFCAFVTVLCGTIIIPPRSAVAHGFEGDFFFPPTPTTDDPFAVDELSFPSVQVFNDPAGDGSPKTREVDIGAEFDKEIFPKFALGIAGTWTQLNPKEGETVNGFQNFTLKAKYQLLENPAHEFILSIGGEWEMGGSGGQAIGADSFSTFTPTIYVGKGFGDLPDSVPFLRPLGITATVGEDLPTEIANPNALEWAFALEYSLPYLEQNVKDTGLPHPFRDMIPLVELALQSQENRDGGATTGTVNPGVLYESKYFQLGAEAVIPINGHTGHNVGFIVSAYIFIDDLLPKLFGHPLFGGHESVAEQSAGGAK